MVYAVQVEIFRYCNAPTLVACSGVSSLWHTIAATHPKIKSTWQFWSVETNPFVQRVVPDDDAASVLVTARCHVPHRCTELSLRLRMPDKITQLYTTRDWSVLCGLLNHYTRARQLEAARSTTNHGAKFVAPMAYVELTLSPHTNKMIHPPQTPQGQTPCCTLRTISFADPMRAERFVAVIVEPPYSGVQTTERKRIPFRVYRAQRNKSKGRLVTASLISRFPSKARKLRVLEEKSVVTALPISVEVHRFAYPDSPPDLVQHLQISPAPLQGSYQPLAFTTSCFRQPPAVLFDFRTRIAVTRTTENVIAVFPLRPWSAGLPSPYSLPRRLFCHANVPWRCVCPALQRISRFTPSNSIQIKLWHIFSLSPFWRQSNRLYPRLHQRPHQPTLLPTARRTRRSRNQSKNRFTSRAVMPSTHRCLLRIESCSHLRNHNPADRQFYRHPQSWHCGYVSASALAKF